MNAAYAIALAAIKIIWYMKHIHDKHFVVPNNRIKPTNFEKNFFFYVITLELTVW